MWQKKLFIIGIGVLSLAITTFACLYYYGAIGSGKNQSTYVDEYLNEKDSGLTNLENLRLHIEAEANHWQQVMVTISNNTGWYLNTNGELCASNNAFKVAIFAKNMKSEMPIYLFYLYDIDYDLVDPANLCLLTALDDDTLNTILTKKNSYDHDENDKTVVGGDIELTEINAKVANAGVISTRVIYDNGAKNAPTDDPYMHVFFTLYTSSVEVNDVEEYYYGYETLENAALSFAIVDTSHGDDTYEHMSVVGYGQTPVLLNTDDLIANDINTKNGFQNDAISLGYNNYIWPQVLITGVITLAITVSVGYAMYRVWLFNSETKNFKNKKKSRG